MTALLASFVPQSSASLGDGITAEGVEPWCAIVALPAVSPSRSLPQLRFPDLNLRWSRSFYSFLKLANDVFSDSMFSQRITSPSPSPSKIAQGSQQSIRLCVHCFENHKSKERNHAPATGQDVSRTPSEDSSLEANLSFTATSDESMVSSGIASLEKASKMETLPSFSTFRYGDLSQNIVMTNATFPDDELAASVSMGAIKTEERVEEKVEDETFDEAFLDRIKFALAILQQVLSFLPTQVFWNNACFTFK